MLEHGTSEMIEQLRQVNHRLQVGTLPDARQRLEWRLLCQAALRDGQSAQAVEVLQKMLACDPGDLQATQMLAVACRLEQRLPDADAVFSAGRQRFPDDRRLAFGQALNRYDMGLPSAALFTAMAERDAADLEALRYRALSLACEGDTEMADQVLGRRLRQNPEWLEGHAALAALRWTRGRQESFAESYATACQQQPHNKALWFAWFGVLAQARLWSDCRDVLTRAEDSLGTTPSLLVARFLVATESGDRQEAQRLMQLSQAISGDTVNMCRIRHLLRERRLNDAQDIALPLTRGASARLYWPYVSLIWRLLGDTRHEWLDRPDSLIRSSRIALDDGELAELAEVLRQLHVMQRPYLEQSVRKGTQTDGSILLHHEPILQRARAAILDQLRTFVASLPAPEAGHPLLGTPRTSLLIEGSWSVRLQPEGYNVPHTHPKGWISATLYVSLPDRAAMGTPPAGNIAFGAPPPELDLELPAYRHIEPQAGLLAMFPSTTWHGTVPFNDGERLVIALDLRSPR